ncbi:MAG TPA: DUF6600 domain-containing protein [Thermoanaerobaculia bacterium]
MKSTRIALFALLLLGALAGAASAQTSISAGIHVGPGGRAAVDLGFFYDDLASYGNWIQRPSYGWVWTPQDAAASWRPYQDGHWVWTDQGWTWVTDEPYGWATYHYGRWYDDPEIGWAWVPGQEWGPSWVSWQEGSNYVGWAPLPPSININPGFSGLLSVTLAPAAYVFVQERYFLAPRIVDYVVPQAQVVTVFRQTRNYTNYRYNGGRVYNDGIPVANIQRVVGRPVPRYQLADLGAGSGGRRVQIQGNRVAFFRPQVQKAANIPPPPARPVARKAVVDASQFQSRHPERVRAAQAAPTAPATSPAPARPARQRAQASPQVQPSPRGNAQNRANRQNQAQGQAQEQNRPPAESAPPARQQRQTRQRQPQPAPADQGQPPPARLTPPREQAPAQNRQPRQRPPQAAPDQQQRQRPPQAAPKQQQQQENQKKRREQQPPPPPPGR